MRRRSREERDCAMQEKKVCDKIVLFTRDTRLKERRRLQKQAVREV